MQRALSSIGVGKAANVAGTGVENFHSGTAREARVIGNANVSYSGQVTKLDEFGSFFFRGDMWLSGKDEFNFEMHPWTLGSAPRNIATKLVDPGAGKSFFIHMVGKKSVTIVHLSHVQDWMK